MLVVERLALLAAAAHGVVLTVVAHSPADVPRGQVDGHVEVARVGVFIAVTLCTTRPRSSKASKSAHQRGVAGRKLILETKDHVQAKQQ